MAMHRDGYAAEALHDHLVAQKAAGVVERLTEEEAPRPDAPRQ